MRVVAAEEQDLKQAVLGRSTNTVLSAAVQVQLRGAGLRGRVGEVYQQGP